MILEESSIDHRNGVSWSHRAGQSSQVLRLNASGYDSRQYSARDHINGDSSSHRAAPGLSRAEFRRASFEGNGIR